MHLAVAMLMLFPAAPPALAQGRPGRTLLLATTGLAISPSVFRQLGTESFGTFLRDNVATWRRVGTGAGVKPQ